MQKQEILKTIAERVSVMVAGMDEEIRYDDSGVYSWVNDETFFIELEEVRCWKESYYCSGFQADASIFNAEWVTELWADLDRWGVLENLEAVEELVREEYPEDFRTFCAEHRPEYFDY